MTILDRRLLTKRYGRDCWTPCPPSPGASVGSGARWPTNRAGIREAKEERAKRLSTLSLAKDSLPSRRTVS